MEKAVLLSDKPQYCKSMADGEKSIEIRKNKPNLKLPFKCYVYSTKPKRKFDFGLCMDENNEIDFIAKINEPNADHFGLEVIDGKVIGEFICDSIDEYETEFAEGNDCYQDIRRVWEDEDGDEQFEIITTNEEDNPDDCKLLKSACLTFEEIKKYVGNGFGKFYAWHISGFKLYDKPKELRGFRKHCPNPKGCVMCDYRHHLRDCPALIKRPPQSWCYVVKV